jgi:hypothetical protein
MKKTPPFKSWLTRQKMTVPEFVEKSIARGVVTAKVNSVYKAMRGVMPRNRAFYERAWKKEGIRF